MISKHTHHDLLAGAPMPWDEYEWDLGFATLTVTTYSDGTSTVNWHAKDDTSIEINYAEMNKREIEIHVEEGCR